MESKAHAMLVVMRLNSDRGGGGGGRGLKWRHDLENDPRYTEGFQ